VSPIQVAFSYQFRRGTRADVDGWPFGGDL
jgi:hypothetical protein